MASKAVGQQQQGRRTPLSLAGGKNNQHLQQQHQSSSNKMNHNSNSHSTRNQEPRDSTSNKNNHSAKNQHESRVPIPTQKDSKKTHQNGSKHATADDEDVIIVEENGATNGAGNAASNGVPSKNIGNSTKVLNHPGSKDNKLKDKDKVQPEIGKEKLEHKTKKGDAKPTEIIENDVSEVQTTTIPLPNIDKTKDGPSTPTSSTVSIDNSNTQAATSKKSDTTSENTNQKSITPSKKEKTEKSPSTRSSATPSKSPKITEKSLDMIEEVKENDIEPLKVESSPQKKSSAAKIALAPAATSTPGKVIDNKHGNNAKSEIPCTRDLIRESSIDRKSVPRSFSDISGRRSIRSYGDYTPGKYNSQFRESYRRINTELDVTGNTNTSMNVTVGSEIPNNSSFLSFSLFGRGRKRERTPPSTSPRKSQSAVELTVETTPPKRPRLDVHGIFSVMSSPLTMLRTRFSKATLDTPVKEKQATIVDDVQNVSGVSVEEVISTDEITTTEDITVGKDAIAGDTPSKASPVKEKSFDEVDNPKDPVDDKAINMDVDGDIKITETPIIPAVGDPKMKQRGCMIM